ncbi:MAG: right-handed parallel beta-helix repeat-containing protein [Verrucomicrobia bacterium]|nr:right-handed parallel beta-helix repeat-containing protein [Verrucomicrobiota bacterium]
MKLTHSFLFAALLIASPRLDARPFTLYVATNGNDQWSGQLASPASNAQDGPLATLPAALKAARQAREKNSAPVQDGVTIFLRGGRYRLSAPVRFTPDDSGASAKAPLVIAAYENEKPVLSGGRSLTGWKRVEGKASLWQTEVPDVRDGPWYFRTLFINGQRKQRARTPSEGFFRIDGASPQDKPVKLKFKPGDIKKEWAEAGDVEVIALLAWADIRMFIRSVDETNHVATLSTDPRPSNKEINARYFIENAPDGLDAPGEWYLNRRTGVVSYWAPPGEDLATAEVVAGHLDDLVVFEGDLSAKKPVEHVVLRGLTFSYTDWPMPVNGYTDTQAAIAVRGDVRAEAAIDCVVENCTFTHLSGYALELGRGCQRWRVQGNEMSDLGGGGIRIGESAKRSEPFEANYGHIVTDNHLHHLGLTYPPAVGVFILQSGSNRVAHNHIHHLYYTAVSVGWNWGYQETPCRDNIVEFNHMHDIGQSILSDMGAVYTLGIQKGTVIRNNLIHDVNAFTYGGWGLYPDEGSTEIVWENNVVYRCKSAGFHQHYGRENIVRNNVFAFNRENQLMRTREEQHTSFIFTNNIVYFDAGNLLGSNWKNDHFRMGGNVYFDTRVGTNCEVMKFGNASWEQWRARGHDASSVVADPLFVAPDKFDFRLKAESPAIKLGFKPIDLHQVGIRKQNSN